MLSCGIFSEIKPNPYVKLFTLKWFATIRDELNQFTRNDVWFLVPKSYNMNVNGTKWLFKNKLDESGMITRNKARLVAKGYNQEEDID